MEEISHCEDKKTKSLRKADSPRERWLKLEGLLKKAERIYFSKFSPAELMELGNLYFETLSDLGEAQKRNSEASKLAYLNDLVRRAYVQIYQRPGTRFLDLVIFFVKDFPMLVRKRVHFIIGAMLIFAFSAMIGFLCFHTESKLIDLLISEEMKQRIQQDLSVGKVASEFPDSLKFYLSSYIMFHNMEVSFWAFATGVLFGAGTIYLLIINGLFLGGLASLFNASGYSLEFWSFILPHGSIELCCIFISGRAGLILGYSLVNPGQYKRSDWFFHESMDSVKLIIGTIPLFVIAALIETYITPARIPVFLKYFLSGIFFLTTIAYFLIPESIEERLNRLSELKIFEKT